MCAMLSTCMIRVTHLKYDRSNVQKHTHKNTHLISPDTQKRVFAIFRVFEFKNESHYTHTCTHTHTQPHSHTDTQTHYTQKHTETHRDTQRHIETHIPQHGFQAVIHD